jgi:hypothetical protein
MLQFDPEWRFKPPVDGKYKNSAVPRQALSSFDNLISKTATQGDRWNVLETFKGAFANASGRSHVTSSSESWAETDLSSMMNSAADNAPLFLEAFYEACKTLNSQGVFAPDAEMINKVCEENMMGYVIKPPKLILLESSLDARSPVVAVVERPKTLAENAIELLEKSLEQSERMLKEGKYREAVQESLWVLESVSTAFRGLESEGDKVKGKYFNEIVKDLKRISKGTTLELALDGMAKIHGYLSSPTGGGVRHGLDLAEGLPIEANDARLFCNLIRSYTGYLLMEHERLKGSK